MKKLEEKYLSLREWNESEDPIKELANLVGKGGKYSNKEISDYLKSRYGQTKEKEMDLKQIANMLEDHNMHTEYAMIESLIRGNKSAIPLLIMVAKVHEKEGSMPRDLGALRSYISAKDRKRFMSFNSDQYSSMPVSSNTMKIVKKLSKKEQEEFLSLFKQQGE